MTFPWTKISEPFDPDTIGKHYTVLVIGSGYGAGVAAARLASKDPDRTLAVLERGREFVPGEFPHELRTAKDEMQTTLSQNGQRIGSSDALYDMRVGDDVNVLVGCGLGGTSLINANVAIEPDKRIYAKWPKPFRDNPDELDPYFDRAREMLGSNPYPEGRHLPKLDAIEKVAKGMKKPFMRPDINVTFKAQANKAGIFQPACNNCGDCVSGCNYGSKNTVQMNYLPYAKANGAALFTGADVQSVTRSKDGKTWEVAVLKTVRDEKIEPPTIITADVVILGAGALGSTEILWKSKSAGLDLSDQLGERFSTNGDVWAFGYNANMPVEIDGKKERAPVYCVGVGSNVDQHKEPLPGPEFHPGPCITGMVDLRDADKPVEEGLIIEEGVMPGALAAGYATVYPMMNALMGDPFRFGDTDQRLQDLKDMSTDLASDPSKIADWAYKGPVSRTVPYLVMSHDASEGQLAMQSGHITVKWPKAGYDTAFLRDAEALRLASDAVQAEYMPNPLWQNPLGDRLVAVHPLGGCSIGDTVKDGVINPDCEVFQSSGELHSGLFVVDGAALPRAVGVNPHLTITAVAERAVEALATARGWSINLDDVAADTAPLPDISSDFPLDIVVQMLGEVLDGLKQIQQAIDNRMWELADMLLKGLWRQVLETYNKSVSDWTKRLFPLTDVNGFIAVMGGAYALENITGPIIDTLLKDLTPIYEDLKGKNLAEAAGRFEKAMGDFSPPATLPETMVGRITAAAKEMADDVFDAYEAAGTGEDNAAFTGKMRTERIKSSITPGKGGAAITEATLRLDHLGTTFKIKDGTFEFLIPDKETVESWQMIYEGRLLDTAGRHDDLHFRGFKTLEQRGNSHWWKDLTDLRVDIRPLDSDTVVARGMLRVTFEEALRQSNGIEIGYEYENLKGSAIKVYKDIKHKAMRDRSGLPTLIKDKAFRVDCVQAALFAADGASSSTVRDMVAGYYAAQVFARMGGLVLRTYGGLASYMMNFPALEAGKKMPLAKGLPRPSTHFAETEPDVHVKLTRYQGGTKGPVILAGGFGTNASSFALGTVDTSLVKMLTDAEYDVWLFDYRGSGDLKASLDPFNLDDVAQKDWPAAIDLVTAYSGKKNVQCLVHCIGSMTCFMAAMAGETRIRTILSSQLGPHAITNWFNYMRGDSNLADWVANGVPDDIADALPLKKKMKAIAKAGLPVIDPRSPSLPLGPETKHERKAREDFDNSVDVMLYNFPKFIHEDCKSPTCHRINFIFGPSFRHAQLNEATHNAIRHMFGPLSTTPFIHISKIFETGRAVSMDGKTDYFAHPERLRFPIHFIAGGKNQEMLPESSLRTLNWLQNKNPKQRDLYSRTVYPEYGHMDCFIGKNASKEIFRDLIEHLDKTAE